MQGGSKQAECSSILFLGETREWGLIETKQSCQYMESFTFALLSNFTNILISSNLRLRGV